MAFSWLHTTPAKKTLLAKGALWAVGLFVAAGLASYVWLQSAMGRDWAKAEIVKILSSLVEEPVSIEAVDGDILTDLTIRKLALSNALTVDHLNIKWNALGLLWAHVDVISVQIDDAIITAIPRLKESNGGANGWSPAAIAINNINANFESRVSMDGSAPSVFYRLSASDIHSENDQLSLSALLETDDADADAASLQFVWQQQEGQLQVDAALLGRDGGFISALLGLQGEGDINVNISGNGAIENWLGRAELSAGDNWVLHSALKGLSAGIMQIEGDLKFPELTSPLSHFIKPGTAQIDLRVDYQQFPSVKLVSNVSLSEGTVLSDGTMNWNSKRFADEGYRYEITLPSIAAGMSPSNVLQLEDTVLMGRLFGALSSPKTVGSFNAATLRWKQIGAENLSLDFDLDAGKERPWKLTLSGANFRYQFSDTQAITSEAFSINTRLANALDTDAIRFYLDSFDGDWFAASGAGNFTEAGDLVDLDVSGNVKLAGLGKALNLSALDGTFQFDAKGSDFIGARSGRFIIDGQLDDLLLGSETFDRALVAPLALKSDVSILDLGNVQIDQFDVQNSIFALSSSGTIGPSNELNITSDIRVSSLNSIVEGSSLVGQNLELQARLYGKVGAPSLHLKTNIDEVDLAAMTIESLSVDLVADDFIEKPTGMITLDGNTSIGELKSTARFEAIQREAIHFINLNGHLSAMDIKGEHLIFDEAGLAGEIELTMDGEESNFTRASIAGHGQLAIKFAKENGVQVAEYSTSINDLRITEQSGIASIIQSLSGSGKISMADRTFGGGHLEIGGLSRQSLFIEKFSIAFSGQESRVVHAEINGHLFDSFEGIIDVLTRGSGDHLPQSYEANLNGMFGVLAITSSQPIGILTAGNYLTIDAPQIAIGEGSFSFKGDIGESLDATVEFDQASALIANLFIPAALKSGDLSGKASVKLSDASELIDIALVARDLRSPRFIDGLDSANSVRLEAHMSGGNAIGEIEIKDADQTVARFDTAFSYRRQGGLSILADAPLSANLFWDGPIDNLWSLTQISDHILTGTLRGDLAVSGTFDDPLFIGQVIMREGEYQYLNTGSHLRGVRFELSGDQDHLVLNGFEAYDDNGGKVVAEGAFDLTTALNFPGRLNIQAQQLRVIDLDNLMATGSGELTYERSPDQASINGNITIDSVEANLNQRVPKSVITIPVTEINVSSDQVTASPAQSILSKRATELNIDVVIPSQFFVRGRGLESEWRGQLRLRGNTSQPRLYDTLALERGSYSLFGKQFALTSGLLTFRGAETIDPDLDVKAALSNATLRAEIKIGGRLSSPQVSMSSVPALPENEILANILFDTSLSNLGPLQIAQLADALSSISGEGQGLNFISTTRRAVGLDTLSISSDSERDNNTIISGGKYVSRDVYIEVSTATATGEFMTKVLYDLTKRLRAESTLSQQRGSSLKLKWFWDY